MDPVFGLPIRVERNPALKHLNFNGELDKSVIHVSPKKETSRHHVRTHRRDRKRAEEAERAKRLREIEISSRTISKYNSTNSYVGRNAELSAREIPVAHSSRFVLDPKEKGDRKSSKDSSQNKPISNGERKAYPSQSIVTKEYPVKKLILDPKENGDRKPYPQESNLLKSNPVKSIVTKENPVKIIHESKTIHARQADTQESVLLKEKTLKNILEPKSNGESSLHREQPVNKLIFEIKKKGVRKAHSSVHNFSLDSKTNGESSKTAERKPDLMKSSSFNENTLKKIYEPKIIGGSDDTGMTKTAERMKARMEGKVDPQKSVFKLTVVEPKTIAKDSGKTAMTKTAERMKARLEGKVDPQETIGKASDKTAMAKTAEIMADLQKSIVLEQEHVTQILELRTVIKASDKTAEKIGVQMENIVIKPVVEPIFDSIDDIAMNNSFESMKTFGNIKITFEELECSDDSSDEEFTVIKKPAMTEMIKTSEIITNDKRKTESQQSVVSRDNPCKRMCIDPKTNGESSKKTATELARPPMEREDVYNKPGTSQMKTNSEIKTVHQQSVVSEKSSYKRICLDSKTIVEPSHKIAMAELMRPSNFKNDLIESSTSFPLEILGKWEKDIERFDVPEQIEWITSNERPDLVKVIADLTDWHMNRLKPKNNQNKNVFCDDTVHAMILMLKEVFSKLKTDNANIEHLEERSNMFENFNKDIFIHHSAIKMANIDSICGYMFTSPLNYKGSQMLKDGELLYYADISAKPGGIPEYVMWRKNRMAIGFGFNTNNIKTMKLDDMFEGCPQEYTSFHGAKGDGNILDPVNMDSYIQSIMNATNKVGVHFLMSDCSVPTEYGQEGIQEFKSKQMYVAQCILGLSVVRCEGHFIMKLLDVFTPFSVSLIFLMYKCFNKVTIIKPNTGNAASSERYLVCKSKKPRIDEVCFLLNQIYAKNYYTTDKQEIDTFVAIENIQDDKKFVKFIMNSNNMIGEKQFVAVKKMVAFHKDESLIEDRKLSIKAQCRDLWTLNDTTLYVPKVEMNTENYLQKYTERDWLKHNFFAAQEKSVKSINDFNHHVESILNWKFVAVDSHNAVNRTFYMSRGQSDILKYNKDKNSWEATTNINLEMPAQTIVFAEVVQEYHTSAEKMQSSKTSFHIIDAIILGGRDVRKFPLKQRNKLCKMFTESLTKQKPTNNVENVIIRTKELFKFSSINIFYYHLALRKMQDDVHKYGLNSNLNSDDISSVFFVPTGILMMSEVRSDMLKAYSTTNDSLYLFNKTTRKSQFEQHACYESIYASFRNTYVNRFVWNIDEHEQFSSNEKPNDTPSNQLHLQDFCTFVNDKLHLKCS